jgi:sirohydrochlorin ferrochelatase
MSEQGKTYATFIENELKVERDRRTTLDARGLSIVSVSGSLTTILVAVGAFASGRKDFKLPHVAIVPLFITLGAFVVAAIVGIIASAGRRYQVTTPPALAAMLTNHWQDEEVDARNFVSIQHVKTITSLRSGNRRKELLVITGTLFQIGGIIALSVAVFLIL